MKAIDLFAGCGGLTLGFQNAGFEVVAAFDNWEPARRVYQANFNHPIYNIDLRTVTDYSLFANLAPDIIIGGPPCQDYSSAGKRDESLGQADLTLSFAEIITEVRPRFFLMENVDRIESSRTFKQAKMLFKSAGYGLTEALLNASFCGVPQNRKRFFLFGELNGDDNTLLPYYQKNQSRKPLTVFEYLGDALGTEFYYRHPRSYCRRGVFSIYEPSPTIRGVNRPIPKTYKPHPGDAAPISANVRPLTTIERSYIQTFPTHFKWIGSKTDLEQMIGNAVPVKQAEFVARCILEYLSDKASGLKLVANAFSQLGLF